MMRKVLAQLDTCNVIILLPDWRASKGVCIEFQIAGRLGLTVISTGNLKPKLIVFFGKLKGLYDPR